MAKPRMSYFLAAGLIALQAAVASAHHSNAMFDSQKSLTIEGTVKSWSLANPHSYLYVTVPDPATGAATEWTVETAPSGLLARIGWRRNSIKPGDKVIVTIRPTKIDRPMGLLVNIKVNGEQLGPGGPY